MTTYLEPAAAAAAAKCHDARRLRASGVTEAHPRRCGWCVYTLDELAAMVEAFDMRGMTARWFRELPAAQQAAMVIEAQAFEPEGLSKPAPIIPDPIPGLPPEPMGGVPPAPADAAQPILAGHDSARIPDESARSVKQSPVPAEPTWFGDTFGGAL